MSAEKKLIKEIQRFNYINSYIMEQGETPLPPEGNEEPLVPPPSDADIEGAEQPPADTGLEGDEEVPEPVDVNTDPDVEVVGDEGDMGEEGSGDTEELDITDLVDTQKSISDKQDEYMDTIFGKLDDLTTKLSDMDNILNKINDLENKFEKYREKTPQEKLQLRSLDSYPYNQKLSDFFLDKKDEFEKTGKEEYVLTSDDIENYSDNEIRDSFDEPFKEL